MYSLSFLSWHDIPMRAQHVIPVLDTYMTFPCSTQESKKDCRIKSDNDRDKSRNDRGKFGDDRDTSSNDRDKFGDDSIKSDNGRISLLIWYFYQNPK